MRALIFPLLLVVVVASCSRSDKKIIGVVPKGANHIFWQTVHAGALKAGAEHGFEIEWNAPTLEIDSSRQIEIVEAMINKHVAGIALAPVDSKALVSVVERAAAAGIPVAIFDSALDSPKKISFVATNNEEGGRMAARRLAEVIGRKGKVAVIGFMPGSASTMEREHGFQDEIRKNFPEVNVVAMQFGMADRAKSMAATENVLTAHPDLAGLFADNESSLAGTVQALKGRGAKNVKLVGFDASDQLIADLKAGFIDSLVVQNPFRMGYEATHAIGQKISGQAPVALIDSGATLVKREDLEKPEVKELLFPDLSKYIKVQGH